MDDLENIRFESFLNEKLRENSMSLKKLSELSGISLRYLENLQSGNFRDLPSAPYLYAYVKKIGDILGFDPVPWLDEFEKRSLTRSSGSGDYLPKNRFRRESVQRYVWIVLAVLALFVYLAFRLPKIFGRPALLISSPDAETATVGENSIVLRGQAEDARQVFINGETVVIARDGSWGKQILLQPGLNTFEITAKKFLGQDNRQVRQVFYEPPAAPEIVATSAATSTAP